MKTETTQALESVAAITRKAALAIGEVALALESDPAAAGLAKVMWAYQKEYIKLDNAAPTTVSFITRRIGK